MTGGTGPGSVRGIARLRPLIEPVLVVLTVGALAAGGIAWLTGWREVADGCWIAGTVLAALPALVWVAAALRRGRLGVDVIAVLALVGSLLVHEYLAGALIAVMLAGGRALDAAACPNWSTSNPPGRRQETDAAAARGNSAQPIDDH